MTKQKARRSRLLELPKIAVAIVRQQLPSGSRHLAFIYPSRTLRRRLHSMVGIGLIPYARAAWFGMLLTFGWTVAATVWGNRRKRVKRTNRAEVFAYQREVKLRLFR